MAAGSWNRTLTMHRLTIAFLILLAIYLFQDSWLSAKSRQNILASTKQPDTDEPHIPIEKASHAVDTITEDCRNVPGADNVLVMLKTGATEIYEKLPTHFVTLFKCTPHYMIFSDLAQDYADFPNPRRYRSREQTTPRRTRGLPHIQETTAVPTRRPGHEQTKRGWRLES